jgi:hypothetical protein
MAQRELNALSLELEEGVAQPHREGAAHRAERLALREQRGVLQRMALDRVRGLEPYVAQSAQEVGERPILSACTGHGTG